MSKDLKEKLKDRHVDMSYLTMKRSQGLEKMEGTPIVEKIKEIAKQIAEITAKMSGYKWEEEEESEDWKPDFADREELLALDTFPEYCIHFMGLAGWAYRNIDEHPNMVYQQIYELARRIRISRAEYMRTFLINGSRKPGERYMMDALPWAMVNLDGKKKKIDFDVPNAKWWKVVRIIEEACKYWKIHHQPTFRMARYNQDIFNADNNVQGIHGEWSEGSAEVTIAFMRDYMGMQKKVRNNPDYKPPFEFFNEPQCANIPANNHAVLGMIADYHLKMWRGVEDLTIINKAMACSRACEGAHANFVGKHWFDGRYYGSDEFKDRKIKVEFHGVSTLQTLFSNGHIQAGLGSGWWHLWYNEDGSGDGSYSPIPWTPFRLANAEELNDMLWYGHTECEKKRKTFGFTCFMLDCLRQDAHDHMIAKEEFDPEQLEFMNWDRAIQYRKMREEL